MATSPFQLQTAEETKPLLEEMGKDKRENFMCSQCLEDAPITPTKSEPAAGESNGTAAYRSLATKDGIELAGSKSGQVQLTTCT
jgi:hypothetical protein